MKDSYGTYDGRKPEPPYTTNAAPAAEPKFVEQMDHRSVAAIRIADLELRLRAAEAEREALRVRVADLLQGLDGANDRWLEVRAECEVLRELLAAAVARDPRRADEIREALAAARGKA